MYGTLPLSTSSAFVPLLRDEYLSTELVEEVLAVVHVLC